MTLRIYNSLTRTVEDFVPMHAKAVNMFVCGPTVYDLVHLGNARTATVFDVAAKWLKQSDYKVNFIQNITDIDDKIIKRAGEQGRDPLEYAREYDDKFRADMLALGNTAVSQYARATDHIDQVISQVKTLITKGNVYRIDGDGWYFDLSTFPDYGKLSGRTGLAANDAVSRIDDNDKKRNTGDFCVWKLSKPGEPVWQDAELGAGRPGWHIEDTAITEHYFGPQYDLHGGGMDLKFPHHEAEIAQQEAASGKVPFVKYWMHVGFLESKNEKMSKSLGNLMTLDEALGLYSAETLRFFLLSNHYRSPLEFNGESLKAAEAATQRLFELDWKLVHLNFPESENSTAARELLGQQVDEFQQAMDDDFNTPKAFAALFDLVKGINKLISQGLLLKKDATAVKKFFVFVMNILGIIPMEGFLIHGHINALIEKRQEARDKNDFITADALRGSITDAGYQVDDTPYGPLVKKK